MFLNITYVLHNTYFRVETVHYEIKYIQLMSENRKIKL